MTTATDEAKSATAATDDDRRDHIHSAVEPAGLTRLTSMDQHQFKSSDDMHHLIFSVMGGDLTDWEPKKGDRKHMPGHWYLNAYVKICLDGAESAAVQSDPLRTRIVYNAGGCIFWHYAKRVSYKDCSTMPGKITFMVMNYHDDDDTEDEEIGRFVYTPSDKAMWTGGNEEGAYRNACRLTTADGVDLDYTLHVGVSYKTCSLQKLRSLMESSREQCKVSAHAVNWVNQNKILLRKLLRHQKANVQLTQEAFADLISPPYLLIKDDYKLFKKAFIRYQTTYKVQSKVTPWWKRAARSSKKGHMHSPGMKGRATRVTHASAVNEDEEKHLEMTPTPDAGMHMSVESATVTGADYGPRHSVQASTTMSEEPTYQIYFDTELDIIYYSNKQTSFNWGGENVTAQVHLLLRYVFLRDCLLKGQDAEFNIYRSNILDTNHSKLAMGVLAVLLQAVLTAAIAVSVVQTWDWEEVMEQHWFYFLASALVFCFLSYSTNGTAKLFVRFYQDIGLVYEVSFFLVFLDMFSNVLIAAAICLVSFLFLVQSPNPAELVLNSFALNYLIELDDIINIFENDEEMVILADLKEFQRCNYESPRKVEINPLSVLEIFLSPFKIFETIFIFFQQFFLFTFLSAYGHEHCAKKYA